MASKSPGLPAVPTGIDPALRGLLEALCELVQIQAGQRGDPKARAVTAAEFAALQQEVAAIKARLG